MAGKRVFIGRQRRNRQEFEKNGGLPDPFERKQAERRAREAKQKKEIVKAAIPVSY